MRTGARVFTAGILGLLPATTGLLTGSLAADAAGPVQLVGGCWTYVPGDGAGFVEPPFNDLPSVDLPDAWLPWAGDGAEAATATLAGDGASVAVAGQRTATVTLTNGPVLRAPEDGDGGGGEDAGQPEEFAVTAHFVLSLRVPGAPERRFVAETDEFIATAGVPLPPLQAEHTFRVQAPGEHVLRLESVYFDMPAAEDGFRVACNGQELQEPTAGPDDEVGRNPATEPVATDVQDEFHAVLSPSVGEVAVSGQVPLTDVNVGMWSARAGDAVSFTATGLVPGGAAAVHLCASGGECSEVADELVIGADGTLPVEIEVPDGLAAGVGVVRVDSPAGGVLIVPLRLLDAPRMTVTEVPTADGEVEVTVVGASWDPRAVVELSGRTETGASADKPLAAEVDGDGAFTATFTLADVDSRRLLATQQRRDDVEALSAEHLLENVPSGTGRSDGPGSDDSGSDSGTSTPAAGTPTTSTPATSVPPAATPVAAPAAAIPLPGELDVTNVNAPPVEPPIPELTVSSARLSGSGSFGELFGGAPSREVVFMVENTSTETVANPIVRLGLGRTGDAEPLPVAVEVGELAPGDKVVLEVPVELPLAAIGTYQVVGQVGETEAGAFTIEWKTYPWGLFALNGFAVALLAWGVRQRLVAHRRPPATPWAAAGGTAGPAAMAGDDAVVDLAALGAWWGDPSAASADEHDSVVDLAAADAWWARREHAS